MRKPNLARAWFWISSFGIVFAYGVAVGAYRLFPFQLIKAGQDAVGEVLGEVNTVMGTRPDHFLSPAYYPGSGVTRYEPAKTAPGLTFIAAFFDGGNEMRLIQQDGQVVNRWPVKFSEIFLDTSHIQTEFFVPKTDWNVEIHGALALPDGSVIFNFERAGLARVDRCGTVQWALPRMTHHVVEPSEDGNFWVGGARYIARDDERRFPLLTPPYYEESVMKVSPEGEVLEEISLLDVLFANNLHGEILFANGVPGISIGRSGNKVFEGITHLNDVEELTSELAPHFPEFAQGDLLLSERDFNLIMVIEPETGRVKWFQRGPWIGQHDPDFESNGRIGVFNNNADGTEDGDLLGGSSILEIDPFTRTVTRRYGGRPDQEMFSNTRGKQQYLDNGDLLITQSNRGRIIEVDADGNVVWEYIARYDDDNVVFVTQATRYGPDYFQVSNWGCPTS